MSKKSEAFSLWAQYKKQEAQMIREFKRAFSLEWESNIGNDCAVYTPHLNKKLLMTKDLLVEGVHFFSNMPLDALAYKSLIVNLSDIFADGGTPQGLLLGLVLPRHRVQDMLELAQHFTSVAKQLNVPIIGGDTVAGQELAISVTCFGETATPWLRKNAQTGDYIYISGEIGGSGEGFRLLQNNQQQFDMTSPYIKRHCFPPHRLALVSYLQQQQITVRAGVDVSDGFLEDLTQILLESEKSCEIYEEALPVASGVDREQALFFGEDYELIFTSPELLDQKKMEQESGVRLSLIGKIIDPQRSIAEIYRSNGEKFSIQKYYDQKFFHF